MMRSYGWNLQRLQHSRNNNNNSNKYDHELANKTYVNDRVGLYHSKTFLRVVITMAMVNVDGSCQFSADSQPKSTGLVWGLAATRSVYIHQMNRVNWYSFYHSTWKHRHCNKGAQPVPKAVYHSGCRDQHNRPRFDSNLGPLTSQSDALTTAILHGTSCRFLNWIFSQSNSERRLGLQ